MQRVGSHGFVITTKSKLAVARHQGRKKQLCSVTKCFCTIEPFWPNGQTRVTKRRAVKLKLAKRKQRYMASDSWNMMWFPWKQKIWGVAKMRIDRESRKQNVLEGEIKYWTTTQSMSGNVRIIHPLQRKKACERIRQTCLLVTEQVINIQKYTWDLVFNLTCIYQLEEYTI